MADEDPLPSSAAILRRIAVLPLAERPEQVVEVMSQVEAFQDRARELRRQLELALIEYIDEHGDIEWQGKRWYVGPEKDHKLRLPMAQAVEILVEATGGDLAAFAELLSASAVKHGAARTVLGDRFDEVFKVETRQDLKTGKPKRAVKVADDRFVTKPGEPR